MPVEFNTNNAVRYQSAYNPLPVETFDETGRILQEKYYRNQAAEDKLFQYLNNLNLHDQDKPILDKTMAEVNMELQNINGEYHKAGNIIRNVVRNLDSNQELKLAIQDKALYDAQLSELQKAQLDPKSGITKKSIEAFVTYAKYSKRAPITKNPETGLFENRLSINTPPPKIDTYENIERLVKTIKDDPDATVKYGKEIQAIAGQLRIPINEVKGIDSDKLRTAVAKWIETTPEVVDYYNYVNTADMLNRFGDGDVPIDNLLSDFGLNVTVDDKGNKQINAIVKDKNGKPTPIQANYMDLFKGIISESTVDGVFDEEVYKDKTRNLYVNLKTNMDLGRISDFASTFAFTQVTDTSKYFEDAAYKLKLEQQAQKEQIVGLFTEQTGIQVSKNFNIKEQEAKYKVSQEEVKKATSESKRLQEALEKEPDNEDLKYEFEVAKRNELILRNKANTDKYIYTKLAQNAIKDPTIKAKVDLAYDELVKDFKKRSENIPNLNIDDYVLSKQELYNFLTSKSDLPLKETLTTDKNKAKSKSYFEKDFPMSSFVGSSEAFKLQQGYYNTLNDDILKIKSMFQDATEKKAKTDGVKGTFTEAVHFISTDKNGAIKLSDDHKFIADWVFQNSPNFEIVKLAGSNEVATTLDKEIINSNINLDEYIIAASPAATDVAGIGMYKITLTPKTATTEKDKKLIQFLVKSDAESAAQNTATLSQNILGRSSDPAVRRWAMNELTYANYGLAFEEAEDVEYGTGEAPNNISIFNVPFRTGKGIVNGDGIVVKDKNLYVFKPAIGYDSNNNPIYGDPYAGGNTIKELMKAMLKQTYQVE